MIDPEWATTLMPLVGKEQLALKCGHCQRQLDTLVAVVSGDASYVHNLRVPSKRLGVPVGRRAQQSRPEVVVETFGAHGRRWVCPCGRRFERNLVKLRPVFLRHVRAGADLLLTS